MKDEEMAEEYANKHTHYEVGKRENGTDYAKKVSDVTIQQAFLDGLKIGRQEEQLTKAKEVIENLLGVLPDEVLYHDYYKRTYVDPAEQFLKEIDK